MITLYGAAIFLQNGDYEWFKTATSVFILLVNANFLLLWFYVLLKNVKKEYVWKRKIVLFMEKWFKFKDLGHEENIENLTASQ